MNRDLLRDTLLGANDGVMTTVLFVAGVLGSGLPRRAVLLAGLAVAVSGALSMGAGAVMAALADQRRAAVLIAGAFAAGSALVLAPFVAWTGDGGLVGAVAVSAGVLFGAGIVRAKVTGGSWWRSGLLVLGLGAATGLVSWALGMAAARIGG